MKVTNKYGVSLDCSNIADLWHIAMAQKNDEAREAILEVWKQAHTMRDALIAIRDEAKSE